MDPSAIENRYKKLDHREHVLSRPGMYIGSIDEDAYNTWVFDFDQRKLLKKDVRIIPGLYKIYDEILVNAIDHVTRLKMLKDQGADVQFVKNIKVTIDKSSGTVSVFNDGDGIEVEKHPEHNIYIPELIFGNMLTSTNYNDEEEKVIGGQNGIGAKACNIFSKYFKIETVDGKRKKLYVQEFSNNMTCKTDPIVKYCAKKPYTIITFTPDFDKFKMKEGLTDDMYSLFMKRAYDVCALTDNDINVWINGEKIEYKNFERYVDLYIGNKSDQGRFYEKLNDRWEVVATNTTTENMGFEQVSFVNGIWTIRGGKHVDYLSNQIASQLCIMINSKKKDMDIKPQHIKNFLMLFVKSTITNPTFDSQTKDLLTTPVTKFGGVKPEVSEKFIEKLYKSDIVAQAIALFEMNTNKTMKKTDGKKATKLKGMVKLEDANFSGTNKSNECTLILTEGDSAKSMALAGLSEIGQDYYGVFPLRGKLMNVKDVTLKKLMENEEIQNIKKILGLESNKNYIDINDLRYGSVMIMSDQDHDGSHIRGLVINMFYSLWPSLAKRDGFIKTLLTPIIKVRNKRTKEIISFYTIREYDIWMKSNTNMNEWNVKYYKGLGTSNDEEAKEYFKNMRMINYKHEGQRCENCIDLAFNKKRSDDRKKWLEGYKQDDILEGYEGTQDVSYSDFINKELIHFSVHDVKRSVPSMVDGLKPSQRKILYSCFKRNLITETKVSQLAGYVSENAAYHHGDASLQAAIIAMAQDFVGSNNLNLLKPNGQFGSRRLGGKDASASRYIFTELERTTFKIFRKDDNALLKYLDDDGFPIEPEYYVPIIPMALVNGCVGIGTGFSTNIPAFNPLDVVRSLKHIINSNGVVEKDQVQLVPWYRGFQGSILPTDESYSAFVVKGCYKKLDNKTLEITELPVGTWTDDYKEFLEDFMDKNPKVLKDYEAKHDTYTIKYILHFCPNVLDDLLAKLEQFEKDFKLVSKLSLSNMHLFNDDGVIKKYNSIVDILLDFYRVRLAFYENRIRVKQAELEQEMKKMKSKARFVKDVCDHIIPLLGIKKDKLETMLKSMDYETVEGSYGYLTSMPIHSLTEEKIQELNTTISDLQEEYDIYARTTGSEIWLKELCEVEAAYSESLVEYDKKMKEKGDKVVGKRKIVRKKA